MDGFQEKGSIHRLLAGWYQTDRRDLPWRGTGDPYKIWVSEVMLQQTQVKTVKPYYQRFIKRFPTAAKLAGARQQTVLRLWEGLGYYARARNLHAAAKIVTRDFDRNIPNQIDLFRKLPGVGAYISAAVMSIAFNQPYAVVDGNVKRVLARLLGEKALVNDNRSHGIFQRHADALLDTSCPGRHNQAMMELGALICKPSAPLCGICPVASICKAHNKGQVKQFPRRKARKEIPVRPCAVGVIVKGDEFLITRRPQNGLLGGLWEFPGGKINPAESPLAACRREIKEETGLIVKQMAHLTQIKHAYTHFKIIMDVFVCRYSRGKVTLNGPVDFRWVSSRALRRYPMPKANLKFLPKLLEWCKNR